MVKDFPWVSEDARLGCHLQYHHVDGATTCWGAGEKAVHFHLNRREKHGHVDGLLSRARPQAELINRSEHLRVTRRFPNTVWFDIELASNAIKHTRLNPIKETEDFVV